MAVAVPAFAEDQPDATPSPAENVPSSNEPTPDAAEATPTPTLDFRHPSLLADSPPPAFDSYIFTSPFGSTTQAYVTKRDLWASGPHQVELSTSLVSAPLALTPGDPLSTGMFNSSLTYRYRGLFGGIVRPVARMSVGGAQLWLPARGAGGGLTDALTPYAVPEAGFEIVYKGYGVGMTVSYPMALQPYDAEQKFSGYEFAPQHRGFNWDQLLKNIYLVVE
jgi:hypothetical protein